MTRKLAWTQEEDERLARIIKGRKLDTSSDDGPTINASWGEIAELMPDRSAKQCRERWCYNLNPSIKRDIWTAEEDAILVKAQAALGNQWALIARNLPGRTENSVKTRHKSIVRARKRAWREEEDSVILSLHRQIGSRWDKIADRLPGRTPNGVKTRYSLLRKGLAHIAPVLGSPDQILHQKALIEKVELKLPLLTSKRSKRRRLGEESASEAGSNKKAREHSCGPQGEQQPVRDLLNDMISYISKNNNIPEPDARRIKAKKMTKRVSDQKTTPNDSKSPNPPNTASPSKEPNGHLAAGSGDTQEFSVASLPSSIQFFLRDETLPAEVRTALLAQAQQIMMYSPNLNLSASPVTQFGSPYVSDGRYSTGGQFGNPSIFGDNSVHSIAGGAFSVIPSQNVQLQNPYVSQNLNTFSHSFGLNNQNSMDQFLLQQQRNIPLNRQFQYR